MINGDDAFRAFIRGLMSRLDRAQLVKLKGMLEGEIRARGAQLSLEPHRPWFGGDGGDAWGYPSDARPHDTPDFVV